MKNKGLTSSIVISIFLTIMLLMILFLATNSFKEALDDFTQSTQEQTQDNPGAGIAIDLHRPAADTLSCFSSICTCSDTRQSIQFY